MTNKKIDESVIREYESFTVAAISAKVQGSVHQRQVPLLSPEIWQWIATQIVLPILTGMISSVAYDKFKSLSTKGQAAEARDFIKKSEPNDALQVSEEELAKDLRATLTKQGIPEEVAKTVVKEIIAKIKSDLPKQ